MKKLILMLSVLIAGVSAMPASAVTTLYDNGLVNGTVSAVPINGPQSISNSFTLSFASTLTEVQAGLWVNPGDTPESLDWSIGTTVDGSEIGSGTASLSNTFDAADSSSGFFDFYESSFAVSGSTGAGTYWLTLGNAATTNSGELFWAETGGASVAKDSPSITFSSSESFEIFGTPDITAVPEPVSSTLIGVSAMGLIMYVGKRRRGVA